MMKANVTHIYATLLRRRGTHNDRAATSPVSPVRLVILIKLIENGINLLIQAQTMTVATGPGE